jgi:hypothetical protein
MSLRPLASLAVKMLGLYAVVNALPTLSHIIAPFTYRGISSPAHIAVLAASGGVLQMLVGIGLWFFSDGIAHSAVPQDGDTTVRRDEGLTAIGFSVVGIYLLSDAVVKFAHYTVTRYEINAFSSTSGAGTSPDMYTNLHVGTGDLIVLLIQAALGLYLVLGGQGLVRGLANFKNVGRDADMEKTP